jgi:hypothetical protein
MTFESLIEKVTAPTVVPNFRAWIDHLLSRSEDGVFAIAAVANILPNWLRMRDILSKLHGAAMGAINGVLALGGAAVKAIEGLPTMVKVAGIAVLAVGGVFVVTKLSAAKQAA